MQCRHCGHENEGGANYCSSCGEPLDEDTTVALDLIEDRRTLEHEMGEVLADLEEGVGMLVVRRGPNAGSTFVLDAEETSVGRHPDSDIFLDDVTVSRRHARITRSPNGYEVSDAGSLNGTYVDHERVEKTSLRDMHELQVGRFVLTFVVGGPAESRQ